MPTVNMLDAKTQLSRLVDLVERGEEAEIIIARNGRPAARLVPVSDKPDVSRRIGAAEGKFVAPEVDEDLDREVAGLFGIDDD